MPKDDYLKLNQAERLTFIDEISRRSGIAPWVLEKDYWVTWTLAHLFSLPPLSTGLIFKGGTSLSKVYRAIHRFSEDIDISINRTALGFGGNAEPEKATSKNKGKAQCEALEAACSRKIAEDLLPALRTAFTEDLGREGWSLSISEKNPHDLIFAYAAVTEGKPYSAQSVLIEMGPDLDHQPQEMRTIAPLIGEYLEGRKVELVSATVRVLAAERTVWEKATLLHATCHLGAEKLKSRYARHFYDLAQLSTMEVATNALNDMPLLQRVVEHKKFYYRSAGAKYELAVPGTFRLVPEGALLKAIVEDYTAMQEMFFGEAPTFDSIIERLQAFEGRINALVPPAAKSVE